MQECHGRMTSNGINSVKHFYTTRMNLNMALQVSTSSGGSGSESNGLHNWHFNKGEGGGYNRSSADVKHDIFTRSRRNDAMNPWAPGMDLYAKAKQVVCSLKMCSLSNRAVSPQNGAFNHGTPATFLDTTNPSVTGSRIAVRTMGIGQVSGTTAWNNANMENTRCCAACESIDPYVYQRSSENYHCDFSGEEKFIEPCSQKLVCRTPEHGCKTRRGGRYVSQGNVKNSVKKNMAEDQDKERYVSPRYARHGMTKQTCDECCGTPRTGLERSRKKIQLCKETEGVYDTPLVATPSTAITSASSSRCECTTSQYHSPHCCVHNGLLGSRLSHKEADCVPCLTNGRLYNTQGPVSFSTRPVEGARHPRAELQTWATSSDVIISQNSSKRKVRRGIWVSSEQNHEAYPAAIKFVEDGNVRDGRSIKREIECHLFIYQHLVHIQKEGEYSRLEDAWPSAELLGYHLNKKNPGQCTLITRKLSGPDFFDIIRQEHNNGSRQDVVYQYHKLYWCLLALKRIQHYAHLGVRHNDVKPDNIVLDFHVTPSGHRAVDVKIIDLGTASMWCAKEFTGGTSWYESPEQKMLEYYCKKQKNTGAAQKVNIGLSSDVWAAGLSIAEVLIGRRVVDVMKKPCGPGPLEYRGSSLGWNLPPYEWIQKTRTALFNFQRDSSPCSPSVNIAQCIFDRLVRADPDHRASLQETILWLKEKTEIFFHSLPGIQSSPLLRKMPLCFPRQESPYRNPSYCDGTYYLPASIQKFPCDTKLHGRIRPSHHIRKNITTSNCSDASA